MRKKFQVRNAKPDEFQDIGRLLVDTYSKLEGFPKESEQPEYYKMLANIGEFIKRPKTALLVAVSEKGEIGGTVVYFSNMQYYGSGGTATQEKNSSGFRLLAVDATHRGQGIGKLLTQACIEKAKEDGNDQLIIHTTMSMQVAWNMYEKLGFKRSEDLDFLQESLQVFGFRLKLI
ncbi:MAG: GNAT family N-acetyltransferase [Christiangramia sp.]|nr:GNAT family N-acetyltransferase [Christiangramia sp.]